jgi:hypothetical protein
MLLVAVGAAKMILRLVARVDLVVVVVLFLNQALLELLVKVLLAVMVEAVQQVEAVEEPERLGLTLLQRWLALVAMG